MADAPLTLAELRRDLTSALGEIAARHDDYVKGREYYEGKRAEISDSSVARRVVEQSKRAPVSFSHIPVDVLADKVELASITADSPAARTALESWMDANDIDDEAQDWIRAALYFGDYYAITDPEEVDAETGVAIVGTIPTVGASPLNSIVIYDRKTRRLPEYGVHHWGTGSGATARTKAILYYQDYSVKLISKVGTTATDGQHFDLDYPDDGEPADAYIPHEGDRLLISHLAIGSKPYGTPVHRRAWGFQDAITKISANNLVDVDAKGLPSRWALLDPTAEVDDDLDDDFGTDGPNTAADKKDGLKAATRAVRTRTIPGAIAMLRGVKQTGTYDSGDTDGFLKNLDWYVRGMAVAEGIALFEFDMTGDQPSGESRRRAEGRSSRRAARIKRQATAFFRDVADTALAVAGLAAVVQVTFNPSETSTDKDGLELVSAKVKAGVPLRQALLEAGYTDEQVNAWWPANTPAVSPELLTAFATALKALGEAQTLGVITDDEVRAMLPEILTGARGEGPTPEPAAEELPIVTDAAATIKGQADALGILIRAGVDQQEAAARVGLGGLSFPNLPTTIRVPESDAAGIEEK